METSTQTSKPNYDDPQIAEQAANMTRAIFQHESGMNYSIKGDAGTSTGAGQWQPDTWKSEAQDVLGDSNAPMTPENQNVVAQGTIRKWIAQGLNAAQIAAKWNSGQADGWESKVGTTTINGQQIKYNVPKYVKDVTDLYQQIKSNGQIPLSQPQQSQIFSTPASNIATGNSEANTSTALGALKGVLSNIRTASGVDTSPVVRGQLANAPEFAKSVEAEKGFIQPKNLNEAKGSAMSDIGMALLVPPEVKSSLESSRLARIPTEAMKLAAPKQTIGTVAKNLSSLGANPQIERDAAAIEPLLRSKALSTGNGVTDVLRNTKTLKTEIGKTAQGLISDLENLQIKPIVQPEELQGVFQGALKAIKENPLLDKPSALTSAQDVWNKFVSFLPQEKDITAVDVLKARKATDAWVETIKGSNIFDPSRESGFSTGLRALRQGLNQLVAQKAPDVAVQDALQHQTSLYNVLENVAEKGAPIVKRAQELANAPGIGGIMARHPIATKAVGGALELGGLGLLGKLLGANIDFGGRSQ